jgi:hypothetical protein
MPSQATRGLYMKYLSILFVIILTVMLNSCAEETYVSNTRNASGEKIKIDLSTLKDFLEKEKFAYSSATKRPEAQKPSLDLYSFVLNNYSKSSSVRGLLTENYIAYDYACMKKHLVDFRSPNKDFVSLFVKIEYTKDRVMKRSPSLAVIRKHILNSKDWLGIGSSEVSDLKRNKRMHMSNLASAIR